MNGLNQNTNSTTSLWLDTRGLAVTAELIAIAVMAVVGMVIALTSIRDAVVSELSDVSGSVQDFNQSYELLGSLSNDSFTAGSQYGDALDVADTSGDASGQADNFISFDEPPINESGPPELIVPNPGFEDNIDTSRAVRDFGGAFQFDASDVDSWQTTAADNLIEIWENGFLGVDSAVGNYHAEINANSNAQLFQEFAVSPGDVINYTVFHRGRAGVDTAAVLIGPPGAQVQDQVLATGNTAWVNYSGTYTVPAGVTLLRIGFESISSSNGSLSSGNFIDSLEVTTSN